MSLFNIGFVIFPNLTQLDFTGLLQVLSRLSYRRHAIELATEARRENDPGRQRHLLDLARNYWVSSRHCRQTNLKFSAWAFGAEPKTMRQEMERLSGHHVVRLK